MAKAIAQYTIVALADGSGGITTSDTAPTSPKLNDLWLNTTNNTLYIYNGTNWVTQQSQVVVSSDAPTKPNNNDLWFNTNDNILYIWNSDTSKWITADMSKYATNTDVSNMITTRSKVFIEQPTPPYYVGDLWVIQSGSDAGKIKTCLSTRTNGSYVETDWFTPLSAYTTVSQLTNVLGTDPSEFVSTSKSIVEQFNSVNNELESTNESVTSLSVKASNIEMNFSQSGSGNSLPNSSGQYGMTYWGPINCSYSESVTPPEDPTMNYIWICTGANGSYITNEVYIYTLNQTTGTWSWVDQSMTKEQFLAYSGSSNYISTVGTYSYNVEDSKTRDELIAGTSFKLNSRGFPVTTLTSDPFDLPKSDNLSLSFKVNNNTDYGLLDFRYYIGGKYTKDLRDAANYIAGMGIKDIPAGIHYNKFEIESVNTLKPAALDIKDAYEYTTMPAVGTKGTIILYTALYPYVDAYISDGTNWTKYNEAALADGVKLIQGLRSSDSNYSKIYVLKPIDLLINNTYYWERTFMTYADFTCRDMYLTFSVFPTPTIGAYSVILPINENMIGKAYIYTGDTQTVDNRTYTKDCIYICGTIRTKAISLVSKTPPETMDYNQYWKCPLTQTVNGSTYVKDFYYMYSHANSSLYPITSSFTSSLIETDQYYVYVPTYWNLVPYTKEQCIAYDATNNIYLLPVTGSIFIGDIMVSSGTDVRSWNCMSGENYWGKIIKFSGKDGILIYNPSTNYKRVLNEYSDIAWRINEDGTILAVIWKLTESGMVAKDVEVFGDLKLGYTSDNTTGEVKPIIIYTKADSNAGIDEYFYTNSSS